VLIIEKGLSMNLDWRPSGFFAMNYDYPDSI